MRVDRFGDHQQRGRPVALGRPRLGPRIRVQREPGAVKRRAGVVLARLVIEDEDRFAPYVYAGVVVVAELGRGDAVAGKNDIEGEVEPACGIGKGDGHRREARFLPCLPHGNHGSLAVQAQRQEIEGLQVRGTVGRLEPGLAQLGGEEPRGGVRALRQAGTALERRRRQELEVRAQAFATDLRRCLLRHRRSEGQHHERRHEAPSPHESAVYCVLQPTATVQGDRVRTALLAKDAWRRLGRPAGPTPRPASPFESKAKSKGRDRPQ